MRFLIVILAGLTLLSCGGKTRSSTASVFKVIPDQPIVIAADRVRGDITDTGPWYQYAIQMTNNDTSPITIVAIKITVTGVDATGSPVTASLSHTAGEADTAATDSQPECKYVYFKQIEPNSTALISADNGVTGCPPTNTFIDTGAPGGKDLKNYNYRVNLEFVGWFGPASDPQERFQAFYSFTAR